MRKDGVGQVTTDTGVALTPLSPTVVSVGVGSTSVLGANPRRRGLILVNLSSNRISLAFGVTAVLDSGITLIQNGVFNMGEYDFSLLAINAIASGAGSNLTVQEFEL